MSTLALAETARPRLPPTWRATAAIIFAAVFMLAAAVASLAIGPVRIAFPDVIAILWNAALGGSHAAREAIVVVDVRLPRTLLAALVGAALAVSGAIMQGLFRNPLADPGIVGVASGAALAAALWFVLGAGFVASLPFAVGGFGLVASAFLGSLAVTLVLQGLATRAGRTSVAMLLLAGIALAALTGAVTGLLVFISTEQQLREFVFWSLGSLGGATWPKIAIAAPFVAALLAVAPFLARGLDALALGEAEAFHLGIHVERLKRAAIVAVSAAVGACVAVTGPIGFVGLIVPHLVRIVLGPAHRLLLPVSAFAGAGLLLLADLLSRTLAAPAEIPLGVMTSAAGAPFLLWLLVKRRRELVL
jgi:iron complex transport system permease protein